MAAEGSSWNYRPWLCRLAALTAAVGVISGVAVLSGCENAEVSEASNSATIEGMPGTEPTTSRDSTERAAPATGASPVADGIGSASTATEAVASFIVAASTLDNQLREAAAAINGAGPPWETFTDLVRSAVGNAEIGPVANAIPAGMPDELLQSVILVYSDLVSRRGAMESFTHERDAVQPLTDDMLLAELGNGHPAAVRFDRDLREIQSLASSTPAFTVSPGDSRARAEVLLLVAYVDGLNGGCDGRGGAIVTELPSIEWGPIARDNYAADGGIGIGDGLFDFTAERGSDGTWEVAIIAC